LQPFVPDSDGDRLSDGDELNDFGTDPLIEDSDADGFSDGDEVNNGNDPLLAVTQVSFLEGIHQFFRGAMCGEFCVDEPDSGNIPFFAGYLGSGLISTLPFGVTQVIGLIADLRDFFGAIDNRDWASLGIGTLALIPYVGDAADVTGSIGRFVVRHSTIIGEVSPFLARLDWLPDAVRLAGLQATWGRPTVDALAEFGFEGPRILRLGKASVHLEGLLDALRPLRADFPGITDYLRIIEISDETGVLRGNLLTANLRRLGLNQAIDNLRGVEGALNNIKGAYTQFVMLGARTSEGWDVITSARHVNAAGYDFAGRLGDVIRVADAKAISLSTVEGSGLRHFRSLITGFDDLGRPRFNVNYLTRQLTPQLGREEVERLLRSAMADNFQAEVFVNGPQSGAVVELLDDLLGSRTAVFEFEGNLHEVRLILTPVNR
jgi:hypothetical protein